MPLQITVDPALLSFDVDLFSDSEDVEQWVKQAGLGMGQADFYIQVCSGLNFRTSPKWAARTRKIEIGHCTFIFPHPVDIFIAKLNRLDEKDLRAFETVIRKPVIPPRKNSSANCGSPSICSAPASTRNRGTTW